MSTFRSQPEGSGPVWAWPSQGESGGVCTAAFLELSEGESWPCGPVENTSGKEILETLAGYILKSECNMHCGVHCA